MITGVGAVQSPRQSPSSRNNLFAENFEISQLRGKINRKHSEGGKGSVQTFNEGVHSDQENCLLDT